MVGVKKAERNRRSSDYRRIVRPTTRRKVFKVASCVAECRNDPGNEVREAVQKKAENIMNLSQKGGGV